MEESFQEEVKAFEACKAELLRNSLGKYALFKGAQLIGIYETLDLAYKSGLEKLGNVAMFIQKIDRSDEDVEFPALSSGMINGHL